MALSEHWHTASDGKRLFYRRALPASEPRGVVHVAHGVCEHSARYAPVAEALSAAGWAVYANDHRGHGKTAASTDELGHFDGGSARVLEDLVELVRLEKAAHPGRPVVFFGHSMGSYFGQALAGTHGSEFAAVVLSATNGKPPPIAAVGKWVCKLERLRLGARGRSPVLRAMAFGRFNKPFGTRTAFEWLTRDRAEVDKYVADPLCGFDTTVEFWQDFLDLLDRINTAEHVARIPKDLPLYVFTGSEDMGNERTKGLRSLFAAWRQHGLRDVTERVYPGGRHEMLNELNRDEVHRDLLAWLDAKVPAPSADAPEPAR